MEQNFCLRWFFLCLRPVGLLVCQTIEEGLTTITKTLKLTHTYESISYSFRFPFGTVYYINCYNDAQAETMRLMLLTTTTTKKQYDLIEDDVDVDNLNKQTDKRHDFNHNKCHACVQNDIPPYI